MFKILPLKNGQTPYFVLQVDLRTSSYDYHENKMMVTDDQELLDKQPWNYLSMDETEEIVKMWNRISSWWRAGEEKRILVNDLEGLRSFLNGKYDLFGQELYNMLKQRGVSQLDIQMFSDLSKNHHRLFEPPTEHVWYYLDGIYVFYYDEQGQEHRTEVV